jgi:hypothetical protein
MKLKRYVYGHEPYVFVLTTMAADQGHEFTEEEINEIKRAEEEFIRCQKLIAKRIGVTTMSGTFASTQDRSE